MSSLRYLKFKLDRPHQKSLTEIRTHSQYSTFKLPLDVFHVKVTYGTFPHTQPAYKSPHLKSSPTVVRALHSTRPWMLRGFVNIQFQLVFIFFKWILKILTKIRCYVKKKSPLIFLAIANLQFKHLSNLRSSVKKKKTLLFPAIANLQFKHLFLVAKFVNVFTMQALIFTFFQMVS